MKAITTALIITALVVTVMALSAGAAYQQQETARAQAAARQLEAQVALVAASGQAEIDRAVAESVRTVNAAAAADTNAAHHAPALPAWAAGLLSAAAVFVATRAFRRRQPTPQQAAQLAAAVASAVAAQYRAELSAATATVIEVAPRPAEQPAEIVLF